jgi:hypothetical protein
VQQGGKHGEIQHGVGGQERNVVQFGHAQGFGSSCRESASWRCAVAKALTPYEMKEGQRRQNGAAPQSPKQDL